MLASWERGLRSGTPILEGGGGQDAGCFQRDRGWEGLPLELEHIELVQKAEASEAEAHHALVQVVFLSGGISCGVDHDLGLVACAVEDGQFSGGWRRGAFDSVEADSAPSLVQYTSNVVSSRFRRSVRKHSIPVLSLLLDPHSVQQRLDVAVQIHIPLELVQELALDRVLSDKPLLCVVFSNNTRTVSGYLCDAKGNVEKLL